MKKDPKQNRKPFAFNDESFDFQLMRNMSYCIAQMADVGECLTTAHNIEEGNPESWYENWHKLAQQTHEGAEQSLKKGHHVSAHSAYLRACTYYRSSQFYLYANPTDPRIKQATRNSRTCFAKAIELGQTDIQPVKIPYENTTLPGYFYRVDNTKRPTIIIQQGFDGTQEDNYAHALEALKRGYHVLTFEGPGQGHVILEQNIPFRPDWEVVIKAVVDFAMQQEEVDSSILILYGLSFGGYFAPRGASGDDRIKILIANGGFYDLVAAQAAISGTTTKEEIVSFAKKDSVAFDQYAQEFMKKNTSIRFFYQYGMFTFNVKTPHELIIKCAEYSLENRADLIKCTTLVVDAENEMPLFQGQAQIIYDKLSCPKTYIRFTAEQGGGLHCQMGALLIQNERIFDWLDETILKLKKQ